MQINTTFRMAARNLSSENLKSSVAKFIMRMIHLIDCALIGKLGRIVYAF